MTGESQVVKRWVGALLSNYVIMLNSAWQHSTDRPEPRDKR